MKTILIGTLILLVLVSTSTAICNILVDPGKVVFSGTEKETFKIYNQNSENREVEIAIEPPNGLPDGSSLISLNYDKFNLDYNNYREISVHLNSLEIDKNYYAILVIKPKNCDTITIPVAINRRFTIKEVYGERTKSFMTALNKSITDETTIYKPIFFNEVPWLKNLPNDYKFRITFLHFCIFTTCLCVGIALLIGLLNLFVKILIAISISFFICLGVYLIFLV